MQLAGVYRYISPGWLECRIEIVIPSYPTLLPPHATGWCTSLYHMARVQHRNSDPELSYLKSSIWKESNPLNCIPQ